MYADAGVLFDLTLFALGAIMMLHCCMLFWAIHYKEIKRFSVEYLSISQTAKKWNISRRRIQRLCSEGRIPGAMKIGSYWAIPANAKKPKDKRVKSGRYIKSND